MSYIECKIPPFPILIKGGYAIFEKGAKHFKRVFTVFDLIYVKSGELFITEDNIPYTIKAGQYIILVPGFEHFGHKDCQVKTEYYWLHFMMPNNYELVEAGIENWAEIYVEEGDFIHPATYRFCLPCVGEIENVTFVETIFDNLTKINHQTSDFQLRQQLYFQEFLIHLQKEACKIPTAAKRVVEETVKYVQEHYKEEVKMEAIANALHFHPDYITRCMQKIIGITPNMYLNQYRVNQAKRLLATTDEKVASISKEVGILDSTYFSKLFKRIEGISPLEYRNVIHRKDRRG
ncbi:AraC family transcriptional regulator [Metabacillus sediminilitoris]|uniref:AraC family transcriptional regulator n=1 Tax=Metabacillus sediminilitoris TaxID=2567941 RepID=A0A4S4C018_9BACI|nr:AraC family transcriptional regulator [Metabacillus sediminilitoris]QGQ44623.1 AraC family transcriptional regulator [Metabacillus sediminilitoris]THF80250.1 AraC family transcriptional regulator [Metabacillus sediminilitoris]